MAICDRWPGWFRDLYGGTWPRTYLAIDVETTGLDFDKDVITEIGLCRVEDGVVTEKAAVVLDWSEHAVVKPDWLKDRLLALARWEHCRGGAEAYEWLRANGIRPPEKGLVRAVEIMTDWMAEGRPIAAHNGTFDETMFASNFAGFLHGDACPSGWSDRYRQAAEDFSFPENQYFDTSAIEKISQTQAGWSQPRPGETLRAFWRRVVSTRIKGLFSNLNKHCVQRYGFDRRADVDLRQAHTAMGDAYLVHLLMEIHGRPRTLATANPVAAGLPPPQPSRPVAAALAAAAVPVVSPEVFAARIRGQRNR